MDTNDFLGSFAQENVSFEMRVIKTASVGDNFWKVMIFVENDRFVDTTDSVWTTVPGSSVIKALSVTANDYASHTSGLLKSWLYDLFCNGYTGDCILVACGAKPEDEEGNEEFVSLMTEAYGLLKAYAYHKTVCAGGDSSVSPDIAVALAQLCEGDKELLSSVPYLPFTTSTPSSPDTDALYTALTGANVDAFMSAYQDTTRNGALYSLGLALSEVNGSGTCVGNGFDMIASTNIQSSGDKGTGLPAPIRDTLKNLNIQTFKPVGDNSGSVAAIGAKTLKGTVVAASWIIAYITYMTKVRVAQLITSGNFLKNDTNYSAIVTTMTSHINLFGPSGAGRLTNIAVTAPAFGLLPEAKEDQIIVPNAWEARFVDQIRDVQITGSLYIGV